MNQINITQIKAVAGRIRERLDAINLKETTLNNLIKECHQQSDDFYLALEWLVKENKIFFLKTSQETYILPIE